MVSSYRQAQRLRTEVGQLQIVPAVDHAAQPYVELAGGCENARMLAELTETALQFRDVSQVQFLLDGQPLRDLVLASAGQ